MASNRSLNHKIWDIAWPALLSNISIPLLGLVDTAILGHLDSPLYLGAVAVGASILSFVYWGFSFLRMGTTGLVARAFGAADGRKQLLLLLQSLVLAGALGLLVVLLSPLWTGLGLHWMNPGAQVEPLSRSYISIRVYSAPAVLLTYGITGWFIGRQNTRWPMVIAVFTNLLNIVLDLVFIIGLDMRSDGAALATLVAEYSGCGMALLAGWRSLERRPDSRDWGELRNWRSYRELLDSNRFLFFRTICLLFSFAFFTAMSARQGVDILAANSILLQLLLFASYALDGFAFASEALTGSAAGGRRMDEFYRSVKVCWWWSLLTATGLSVLFALGGPQLFGLFSEHLAVLVLLEQYHLWLVVIPVLAAGSYLLDGVFIGTSRSRYMMHSMLFSTLLVYLPAWYLTRESGNTGLWLAFALFNTARGLSLWGCYHYLNRSNGWLDADPESAD
jgi:MATE family multidrug resistance protein